MAGLTPSCSNRSAIDSADGSADGDTGSSASTGADSSTGETGTSDPDTGPQPFDLGDGSCSDSIAPWRVLGEWTDSESETGRAIEVAQDGAVAVLGTVLTDFFTYTVRVARYDTDRVLLWSDSITVFSEGPDFFLARGSDDALAFATGDFPDNQTSVIRVRKLDADGVLAWDQATLVTGTTVLAPAGLAIDPEGNVIAAGNLNSPPRLRIGKYSPAGDELWAVTLGEAEERDLFGTDVAVAADGGILVVGQATGFWAMKLDPSGAAEWEYETGHDGPGVAVASAAAPVPTGGWAIGGAAPGPEGDGALVVGLGADGVERWRSTQAQAEIRDLIVHSNGLAVAIGSRWMCGPIRASWLAAFEDGGELAWERFEPESRVASALVEAPDTTILVTGHDQDGQWSAEVAR